LLAVACSAAELGAANVGPARPYTSVADGESFWQGMPHELEDFESPESLAPDFLIDCGWRVGADFLSSDGVPIADSVDADDGRIDGKGGQGSAWYCPETALTVAFLQPVQQASLVWTDGDPQSTNVMVELMGVDGRLLAALDAGNLADDFLSGTTAEDRFIGFTSEVPIGSVSVKSIGGRGLEIDHLAYAVVPEPTTGLLTITAIAWLVLAVRPQQRNRPAYV
jgi:hypothetical protein